MKKTRPPKSIHTLLNRILLLMSVLFVVLCLFISFFLQQIVLSNANEHTTITAQKLENQLDFVYEKIESFSMAFAAADEVQQLMSESFSRKSAYINAVEVLVAYYKVLDSDIVDISLVNEEVHYSTVFNYEDLDEIRQLVSGETFLWLGVRTPSLRSYGHTPDILVYARRILLNGVDVGTVVVSVNVSYFQVGVDGEMSSYYLLADEEGVRYSFNSSEEEAASIWAEWAEHAETSDNIVSKHWMIQSTYHASMGCYQLSALNLDEVNKSLSSIRYLIWGSVLFVIVFCVLLFTLIHANLVRPLHRFGGIIRKIRLEGRRGLGEIPNLEGCLEIHEIGVEFGEMLQDIERLNRKIFDTATALYETKVQRQEAELSYMRSQIDPHFLYNTLEAFRKMALDRQAPELAALAVDMGNIFRYSTKGEDSVPLSDEIAIVKSYMHIQQQRFLGKIQVHYFLPPDSMCCRVMKMMLQPIIENAVFHGLEPKGKKGTIYIGATKSEDALVITVKDDGIGISREQLHALTEALAKDHYDTSRHVGILNVHARIRLQYGTDYGLSIESREGDGTTVVIRLPVLEKEEKDVSGIISG